MGFRFGKSYVLFLQWFLIFIELQFLELYFELFSQVYVRIMMSDFSQVCCSCWRSSFDLLPVSFLLAK